MSAQRCPNTEMFVSIATHSIEKIFSANTYQFFFLYIWLTFRSSYPDFFTRFKEDAKIRVYFSDKWIPYEARIVHACLVKSVVCKMEDAFTVLTVVSSTDHEHAIGLTVSLL